MPLPTLTERDRRTVRNAAVGLGIYLVLFVGWQAFGFLGRRHTEYRQLQHEAVELKSRHELYGSRVTRLERLMETFQMDPARLAKPTLVARVGAALQQSALQGGIQLGPIRESLNRGSERELGTIQLEAMGQVPALMSFLHRLRGLGFPLVIDTLQISADPARPGMIKLNLGLILLDFEQWDKKELPDA